MSDADRYFFRGFGVTPKEAKANLHAIMKGEKSGDGVVLMEDDSLEPAVCGRAWRARSLAGTCSTFVVTAVKA